MKVSISFKSEYKFRISVHQSLTIFLMSSGRIHLNMLNDASNKRRELIATMPLIMGGMVVYNLKDIMIRSTDACLACASLNPETSETTIIP